MSEVKSDAAPPVPPATKAEAAKVAKAEKAEAAKVAKAEKFDGHLAKGKAITTKRGIVADGAGINIVDLADEGRVAFDKLVKSGHIETK